MLSATGTDNPHQRPKQTVHKAMVRPLNPRPLRHCFENVLRLASATARARRRLT